MALGLLEVGLWIRFGGNLPLLNQLQLHAQSQANVEQHLLNHQVP